MAGDGGVCASGPFFVPYEERVALGAVAWVSNQAGGWQLAGCHCLAYELVNSIV